jgi:organic hydroperoxide reductase OsmC/OhrA
LWSRSPRRDSIGCVSITRHAQVRWYKKPPQGVARLTVGSDAFSSLPLSVHRNQPACGEVTAGELLAAAYSALLATRLARQLEKQGAPAQELNVEVWCAMSAMPHSRVVEGFEVHVRARAPKLTEVDLRAAAEVARRRCHEALRLKAEVPAELSTSLGAAANGAIPIAASRQ